MPTAGLTDGRALYLLKLSRHFDERMESLHRQGRVPGPIPSTRGEEGTLVGAASALRPEDSLFVTHRGLSAQLAKGVDLARAMATLWGRLGGYSRGRDGIDHLGDWRGARTFAVRSNQGGPCPPAAGAALAYRLRGDSRVAMAICEDGAVRDGRWHGSLAASAAQRLPVVWVVNTRQDGDGTSTTRSAADGMPGVRVDGTDVLEVHAAAAEAVERARAGHGPTLLESVSPPWGETDPASSSGDPVGRFTDLLLAEGVIDEAGLKDLGSRVERAFNDGYEFAQRAPLPDPADLPLGVFARDGYWAREPARAEAGT